MPKESGRIRYHYGFYAAMKVEYDLIHADLTYEQEIQLGEDPIRLDFLIIKKNAGVVLHDPIGEFFEAVNIFEYKSPHDALSIDDFYKAVAYSFIYKGYNRKVDELPIRDMTLTLVRHSYPRELMKVLKKDGFTVEQRHPGIFRVEGNINLKIQIVVSSRLSAYEYEGLQLLSTGCTADDVLRYAKRAAESDDGNVKTNSETVMAVCLDINKGLDSEMEDDMSMNIRETINGIFAVAKKEGIKEGVHETNERVASDMLRNGETLEKVKMYSHLAEDSIRAIAKSLGISIA